MFELTDLGVAIGLLLVIEGALYGLFPASVKKMMLVALNVSDRSLSIGGVGAVATGLALVWVLRV